MLGLVAAHRHVSSAAWQTIPLILAAFHYSDSTGFSFPHPVPLHLDLATYRQLGSLAERHV